MAAKPKLKKFVHILEVHLPWQPPTLLSCWTSWEKAETEKNRLLGTGSIQGTMLIRKEVIQ